MKKGEVRRVSLPSAPGHIQGGIRPGVILQEDQGTRSLRTVLVVPFTSNRVTLRFPGTVAVQPDGQNGLTVLWCYAHAERLARRGPWVVCADEAPNLRVLERQPLRRATPGHIEQQEFEYARHGTANLPLFLVVHTGRMELAVLGSHIAAATQEYLRGRGGWWRVRLTPAHASWLNRAELLVNAFQGRYLKRARLAKRAQ
jgi:mRNA-degrading endonuclease toxin of MazEF toxin-antitoxin module